MLSSELLMPLHDLFLVLCSLRQQAGTGVSAAIMQPGGVQMTVNNTIVI